MILHKYNATVSLETRETSISGLFAYKKIENISLIPVKNSSDLFTKKEEGFTKNLNTFSFPDFYIEKDNKYCLVKKEFIKLCNETNFFTTEDEDIRNIEKYTSKDIFSDLNNENYELIRLEYSSHMIFDSKNQPLPLPIYFDYLSGNMDNAHYNLNKALEILSRRKDIKNLSEIFNIKYYNATPHNNKFICFEWIPSFEDYQKMWKCCMDKYKTYPSTYMHQAIFELDLLGLRAGGAAKYESYYDSD